MILYRLLDWEDCRSLHSNLDEALIVVTSKIVDSPSKSNLKSAVGFFPSGMGSIQTSLLFMNVHQDSSLTAPKCEKLSELSNPAFNPFFLLLEPGYLAIHFDSSC